MNKFIKNIKNNSYYCTRVNNIAQLEYYIIEKVNDKKNNCIIGEYIRCGLSNDDEVRTNIIEQEKLIKDYCKKNNIKNTIEYIDIKKSGTDNNRMALKQMISDLSNGKIQGIIVKDVSRLYRNLIDIKSFLSKNFIKNIQLHSLDNSIESFISEEKDFQNIIKPLNNDTQMINEDLKESEEDEL